MKWSVCDCRIGTVVYQGGSARRRYYLEATSNKDASQQNLASRTTEVIEFLYVLLLNIFIGR